MDYFGSTDPRLMPKHLFWGSVHLDYPSAVRGNPEKQNYSVCPRYWYIDADFVCKGCRRNFTWTAAEQKAWFEDYFFWIDSSPRHCKTCSADRKQLTALRAEYDSIVAKAFLKEAADRKIRVIEIVRELETALGPLPQKMIETKELFERQIEKAQQDGADQTAIVPESNPGGDLNPKPESDLRPQ
ncbi:MAG: hypothetical protein RLZ97_2650 [Verrucomicrobiota bacterium]|jgi:hypothetical protein